MQRNPYSRVGCVQKSRVPKIKTRYNQPIAIQSCKKSLSEAGLCTEKQNCENKNKVQTTDCDSAMYKETRSPGRIFLLCLTNLTRCRSRIMDEGNQKDAMQLNDENQETRSLSRVYARTRWKQICRPVAIGRIDFVFEFSLKQAEKQMW